MLLEQCGSGLHFVCGLSKSIIEKLLGTKILLDLNVNQVLF